MGSGCAGSGVTVMPNVRALLIPHEFSAVTEIVPPVVPAVISIDSVVELPLNPDGNAQVYEVAPDTVGILYV